MISYSALFIPICTFTFNRIKNMFYVKRKVITCDKAIQCDLNIDRLSQSMIIVDEVKKLPTIIVTPPKEDVSTDGYLIKKLLDALC